MQIDARRQASHQHLAGREQREQVAQSESARARHDDVAFRRPNECEIDQFDRLREREQEASQVGVRNLESAARPAQRLEPWAQAIGARNGDRGESADDAEVNGEADGEADRAFGETGGVRAGVRSRSAA